MPNRHEISAWSNGNAKSHLIRLIRLVIQFILAVATASCYDEVQVDRLVRSIEFGLSVGVWNQLRARRSKLVPFALDDFRILYGSPADTFIGTIHATEFDNEKL